MMSFFGYSFDLLPFVYIADARDPSNMQAKCVEDNVIADVVDGLGAREVS